MMKLVKEREPTAHELIEKMKNLYQMNARRKPKSESNDPESSLATGEPKKVAADAVVDPKAWGYCGFCKKEHAGGLADVSITKCWKKNPETKPQWLKNKEKRKQEREAEENNAIEIVVPRPHISPDDI